MHRIFTISLTVVLIATGVYFALYLYGWEWYRAFVVGVVFLSAEVAAVGTHLSSVLRRMDALLRQGPRTRDGGRADADPREAVVLETLAGVPQSYPDHFRWLKDSSQRTSVFIPLLLGAGVLMSGMAWLVERLAGATYGGRIDGALAKVATPLIPPESLLDRPTTTDL